MSTFQVTRQVRRVVTATVVTLVDAESWDDAATLAADQRVDNESLLDADDVTVDETSDISGIQRVATPASGLGFDAQGFPQADVAQRSNGYRSVGHVYVS